MLKTFVIVANFFVQSHFIEGEQHIYTLLGVQNDSNEDAGIEYYIAYSGAKLPVNDAKKFYARIVAECYMQEEPSQSPSGMTHRRMCEAVSISF